MIDRLKSVSPAILIGGVILIITVSAIFLMISKFQSSTVPLYLGNGSFDAKIAYTQEAREKGFGGRSNIPDNEALILAFSKDGTWGIWMKDMKVPIDIIWLDKDKKVVDIKRNVSPEGGTDTSLVPKVDARFVVEVPAGVASDQSIRLGRTAIFDIKSEEIK